MTRGVSDPALTTRDIASWLGTTIEYVRGEIVDGKLPAENVSRGSTKKRYRVRLSAFQAYLRKQGRQDIPSAESFEG